MTQSDHESQFDSGSQMLTLIGHVARAKAHSARWKRLADKLRREKEWSTGLSEVSRLRHDREVATLTAERDAAKAACAQWKAFNLAANERLKRATAIIVKLRDNPLCIAMSEPLAFLAETDAGEK